MNHLHCMALLALALALGQASPAQGPIVYNAAIGTVPSAQCFTQAGGGPASAQIVAGELHVGPTPVAGFDYFGRTDFSIDFDAGFAMEAAFRVASSDCGPGPGSPLRYGIQLSAVDDSGSFCAAHFCSTQVALVNTPNSAIDGINVVSTAFPVAGNTLVARIEVDTAQCTLFVNGLPLLSVPRGTYIGPAPEFYFGDGTGSAGADYFVSYCRASGSGPGCMPTNVASVPSGCNGLGALSFTGVVQPNQPASATFTIPGAGGIPIMLVGAYAMQQPYCTAGCRFGFDPATAILVVSDTVTVTSPAMSTLVGWPIAFQGARIGPVGACSFPLAHTTTDISVMTL